MAYISRSFIDVTYVMALMTVPFIVLHIYTLGLLPLTGYAVPEVSWK